MKIQQCDPRMDSRRLFNFSAWHHVPADSGCYCLANIFDDILYIGKTVDLHRRMDEHLKDRRMTQRTDLGLASWYYFALVDAQLIHQVEDQLLGQHIFVDGSLPPLNRVGP